MNSNPLSSKLEEWKIWQYQDHQHEPWDAQPACYFTDFILAIQMALNVYKLYQPHPMQHLHRVWYTLFFATMGIAAFIGGILHLYANDLYTALRHEDSEQLTLLTKLHIFGYFSVKASRVALDSYIWLLWRIVLITFGMNAYSLICWTARRHLPSEKATYVLGGFGLLYFMIVVLALYTMNAVMLLFGSIPALCFGVHSVIQAWKRYKVESVLTSDEFERITTAESDEFRYDRKILLLEGLIYGIFLVSSACQAGRVSPSNHYFNHNALSHVLTGVAAHLMLLHYYRSCVLMSTTMSISNTSKDSKAC